MNYTLKLRRLEAKKRTCSVSGCWKSCADLNPYCGKHRERLRRYGSVDGRAVRSSEVKDYNRQVRAFLRANAQHPAVVEALATMEELLTPSPVAPSKSVCQRTRDGMGRWRIHRLLTNLHERGLTAKEALIEVAAVWLLSHYDERRLPSGDPLTFALARSILFARPAPIRRESYDYETDTITKMREKVPGAPALRTFGTRIRKELGVFLYRLAEAIEAAYQQKQRAEWERRQKLATPFASTTA